MLKWQQLNKSDITIYKGIAILAIVLHNFMHLFPVPKEMEFEYSEDGLFKLFDSLSHPENIVQILLSYLGHYGVQIFTFISAYGLTKRYLSDKPKYYPYIRRRFATIYPSFLLAIILWVLVSAPFDKGFIGVLKYVYWNIESLIFKITLLANIVPGENFALVGPWWFISFIFQFYFIFPLLLKFYSRWSAKGLVVLSVVSIIITLAVHGDIAGINLYFTIIGHLPELCLGLYMAKNDDVGLRIPWFVVLIGLAVYIFGNIYEPLWYMSHISFLVLLLVVFGYVVPRIKTHKSVNNLFIFFGAISMPLFLVNGFLRSPFIAWAKDYDQWLLTILLCLASLSVSIVAALILQKSENFLVSLTQRLKNKHISQEESVT